MNNKTNPPLCLNPTCKSWSQRRVRGLCVTCYNSVKYLMNSGRVTDQELVAQGKILPVGRVETSADWFLSKGESK